MTTKGHKLLVREDYEHGYIGVLRDKYGMELETIKTRSVKYLQQVARNNKAAIFPKRFRHVFL